MKSKQDDPTEVKPAPKPTLLETYFQLILLVLFALRLFPKQLPAPEKQSDDWDDFGDLEDTKPLALKTPEKPQKLNLPLLVLIV